MTTTYRGYYRGYLGDIHQDLRPFALERVRMDAPQLGGARMPALQYTWSVSRDKGRSFHHPNEDERKRFYDLIRLMCRDCGDADTDDPQLTAPVGFDCGHIAHAECHIRDDGLGCRYANSSDPTVRYPLPKVERLEKDEFEAST